MTSHLRNQFWPFTGVLRESGQCVTRKLVLLAQQKTVFVTVAVNILSYDVAARIDIIQIRRDGSRKIDRSKRAITQQKSMIIAATVDRAPDDVASRIDTKATDCL